MSKLPNGVRIPSVKVLREAIDTGDTEFAILLNGGLVSRKTITHKGKVYRVENHVDGTIQKLTEEQFYDKGYSNIGEAMSKEAFIVYTDGSNPEIVSVF